MEINLTEDIKKMSEKAKEDLILHIIGMYRTDWEKLPFVYCPVCGKEVSPKSEKMKRIIFNPGESVELKSTGQYGQTIIAEVMDDGIITYRIKK